MFSKNSLIKSHIEDYSGGFIHGFVVSHFNSSTQIVAYSEKSGFIYHLWSVKFPWILKYNYQGIAAFLGERVGSSLELEIWESCLLRMLLVLRFSLIVDIRTQLFEFCHGVNIQHQFLWLMRWVFTGCEVYNLGTGKGTSVLEMVAAFEKASGKVQIFALFCILFIHWWKLLFRVWIVFCKFLKVHAVIM